MTFWGFTSTTTNMSITNAFSKGKNGRLILLEGPVDGYDIHEFSQFPCESEILLEPELSVEICGVGKGNAVIQCTLDSCILMHLGWKYYNGDEVEVDKKKALKFYQSAIDKGNTNAMVNVGKMYFYGDGVKVDEKKAMSLFQSAVDKGNVQAMYLLGNMFYNGYGVAVDKKKAMELYQCAADKGDAEAMYTLGLKYCTGDGVNVNKKKAKELFQLLADKGNENASNILLRLF